MRGLQYVICVKECPNWSDTLTEPSPKTLGACYLGLNATTETGMGLPKGSRDCDGASVTVLDVSSYAWSSITTTDNKIYLYRSEPFVGRFCMPKSFNEASQTFYRKVVDGANSNNKLDEYFSDLRNSYGIILISFGFSFVIGIIYLIILRWCTGFIVWSMILTFLGMLLALAILVHRLSMDKENSTAAKNDSKSTDATTGKKLYWTAVVLYIIFAICLCTTCCFFKTIALCIAVLKSAAIFVRQHFCIILIPVIFGLVLFGYAMFALFVLLFLWSIGDIIPRSSVPLGQIKWNTNMRALIWIHLYTILVNGCFLLYYGQFIIVGSASIWYFNQGAEKAEHPSPIKTASWWGIRYHFGSLFFAAFLLSFIYMVKIVLMYVKYQADKLGDKTPDSKVVKFILCILMCLVACFERFIKFINKTGLTMVAITGKHFCSSCLSGVQLLLRHPLKFGLVGILGELFVFLGKIFISCITTLAGYIAVTRYDYYVKNLYSPLIPCVFFFLIGLVIGSIFMSVYGLAADAILLCYLVDKDIVEKSGKPVVRAPAPLKEFFEANKTDSGESEEEKKK